MTGARRFPAIGANWISALIAGAALATEEYQDIVKEMLTREDRWQSSYDKSERADMP